jgi:hypothetical protein
MNEPQPSSDRDHISDDPVGAWILAAEDDQEFVHRVFQGFKWPLDELEARITVVLEDGRLDAGRLKALLERIAVTVALLVELAGVVESELGRCEREPTAGRRSSHRCGTR